MIPGARMGGDEGSSQPAAASKKSQEIQSLLVFGTHNVSPIAWQHINLFGRFEFTQTGSRIDLDALAERYNDPDFWSQALRQEVMDGQMY